MKRFLTFILVCFQVALSAQELSLIFPSHELTTGDTSISFSWNENMAAIHYQIQVASDSTFTSGLVIDDSVAVNSLDTVLASGERYFWRVRSQNGFLLSNWSNMRSFTLFNPSELTCLQHWLSAQRNVTVNGASEVETWNNQGDITDSAVQTTVGLKPLLVDSVAALNNQRSILFDGVNDILDLNNSATIGSAFVIAKWTGPEVAFPSFNGILTQQSVGTDDILFIGRSATTNLWNSGSFGTNIHLNGIPTVNYSPFDQYKIISGVNAAPVVYSNLVIGSDRNLSSRFWKGELVEVITTCNTVTASKRKLVETYLNHKYAPPVNLGPDIYISDNLCDTMLNAGDRFEDYQWSTGQATAQISIARSGSYSVTATDAFGLQTSDTILVTYDIIANTLSDTTICLGDTIQWDVLLDSSAFAFLWQDGSTLPSLSIGNEGLYHLRITDSTACSYFSDTVSVLVDSFSVAATLGSDSLMCSGAALSLVSNAFTIENYFWSTGDTTPQTLIDTAGAYWVEATNDIGCRVRDTILISLKGEKPIAAFAFDTVCAGDTTSFIDLTTVIDGNIINWLWNFGDGGMDSLQNPSYSFGTLGLNSVTLLVVSDSGCIGSATEVVPVYQTPSLSFVHDIACATSEVQFTAAAMIDGTDSIANWHWSTSTGESSSLQNPTLVFDTLGLFDVTLTATTQASCVVHLTDQVEVFPAMNAAFEVENYCTGLITSFTDISTSLSLIDWQWDFGDGFGGSNLQNPSYIYGAIDSYNVTMTVTNVIGCESTASETVVIRQPPDVEFSNQDGCASAPYLLADLSNPDGDSIVSRSWNINGLEVSNAGSFEYTFSDSGSYQVELQVETTSGCIGFEIKTIRISPSPSAALSFTPFSGAAPLEVHFMNESAFEDLIIWDFGDGSKDSTTENPNHFYSNNGQYEVQLIALSNEGCVDTAMEHIIISSASPDLLLGELKIEKRLESGQLILSPSVLLANSGAQTITSAALYARAGNGNTILENWNGNLEAGTSTVFTFGSNFISDVNGSIHFMCVEAWDVNEGTEQNLENNKTCSVISAAVVVGKPYPVPANQRITFEVILSEDIAFSLDVYDMFGRKMAAHNVVNGVKGLNSFTLKTNTFATGKYLLRIHTTDETYNRSFYIGK